MVIYQYLYAMVGCLDFIITADGHLRSHISAHGHQIILARGELYSPSIEVLMPINHILTNSWIISTIPQWGFFQKFDYDIQMVSLVWAHLGILFPKK